MKTHKVNMIMRNKARRVGFVSAWGIFLFLIACNAHHEPAVLKTNSDFTLSKDVAKNIRIDTARMRAVGNELNLTGKIACNEDQVVKVFPLVGGLLEELKIELGDYVKKGQVLATIRSGEMADVEQQMTAAKARLSVAAKNMDVASDMFKSGLSSERDLVAAREEYQQAQGEVKRVQELKHIYGSDNSSVYLVKAPVDGFVVEKKAAPGMELRTDNPDYLFTISNLDKVWVIANVYETDLSKVKEGYEASITTLSYPDRTFKGKIDKIFNVLDPDSKTMKIRVTLDNKDYLLKPEMFASITVDFQSTEQKVAIPAKAVVFDKSRNFVVVYNDSRHLSTREVNIYKTLNGTTYLNSGVRPGERVVSQSQLLVYNALNN